MEKLKKDTEKLCSFYVSDWHLVTMILPYINQKLNEKANVITLLENDIENNIKILTSKLNLRNEEEILKIDWKMCKESKIEEKLQNLNQQKNTSNIIFVNGSKSYINSANKIVDACITNNSEKTKQGVVKVVNCYEVTEFNESIKEILNSHDRILNTSGERNIEDLFNGYKRKMA